jgi:hypothetical protein
MDPKDESGAIHKPLQSRELDSLNSFSETSHFLLNARFSLLDAHFLAIGLLANATLLQIQI